MRREGLNCPHRQQYYHNGWAGVQTWLFTWDVGLDKTPLVYSINDKISHRHSASLQVNSPFHICVMSKVKYLLKNQMFEIISYKLLVPLKVEKFCWIWKYINKIFFIDRWNFFLLHCIGPYADSVYKCNVCGGVPSPFNLFKGLFSESLDPSTETQSQLTYLRKE